MLLVGRSMNIHEILHIAQRPKNAQTGTSALEYPSKQTVFLRMVSIFLPCAPSV